MSEVTNKQSQDDGRDVRGRFAKGNASAFRPGQ